METQFKLRVNEYGTGEHPMWTAGISVSALLNGGTLCDLHVSYAGPSFAVASSFAWSQVHRSNNDVYDTVDRVIIMCSPDAGLQVVDHLGPWTERNGITRALMGLLVSLDGMPPLSIEHLLDTIRLIAESHTLVIPGEDMVSEYAQVNAA